jgi:antitoxin CptB
LRVNMTRVSNEWQRMTKLSGQHGRLRWECRRGMLELDMVLLPFFDDHYEAMTALQKRQFEKLLEQEDPVLQSWFMRQVVPEDADMAAMVNYITEILRQQKE